MNARHLAARAVIALALTSCGPDSLAPEVDFDFASEGEDTSAVTVPSCPTTGTPAPVCSGGGASWAASVRIGATSTVDLELVQSFRPAAAGRPFSVTVYPRALRRLPNGVTATVHADLRVITGGVVPSEASSAIASAPATYASASAAGTGGLTFTFTNPPVLSSSTDYALVLRVARPASGEALLGLATLQSSSFTGSMYRRAIRGATPAPGFTPVGGNSDLAFKLLLSGVDPLQISPATMSVAQGSSTAFSATGGSPDYVFSLASGLGSVSGSTFIAPASAGTATVRVTDALGTTSDAAVTIVAPPPAPSITGTTPASPSGSTTPTFNGTAQASSTVKLYSTSDCSGTLVASGNANGSGSFAIGVTVNAGTTRTLYASATDALGQVSSCSAGRSYTSVTSNTCGTATEGGTVTISCPSGVVRSVGFASYGTPNGSCGSFTTSGCHTSNSASIVSSACLNLASCSIGATNGVFGDPCNGTVKRLYVQVTCY